MQWLRIEHETMRSILASPIPHIRCAHEMQSNPICKQFHTILLIKACYTDNWTTDCPNRWRFYVITSMCNLMFISSRSRSSALRFKQTAHTQYEIVYAKMCEWLSKCLTSPDLRNKAILFYSFRILFGCLLALFDSTFVVYWESFMCVVFILSQLCVSQLNCEWIVISDSVVRQLKIASRGQPQWWWLWLCLVTLIAWNHHPDYYYLDRDIGFVNTLRFLSFFIYINAFHLR